MPAKHSITEVNAFTADKFQEVFKNVVESWPDAAEAIVNRLPVASVDDLVQQFSNYLETVDDQIKHTILCLHPDLAGRLLQENKLTNESANEQASAGLDKLSDNQKEILLRSNSEYSTKFGFPFVICVRESNKIERILEGFEARKNNEKQRELNVAIGEVKKICAIRIKDIVE